MGGQRKPERLDSTASTPRHPKRTDSDMGQRKPERLDSSTLARPTCIQISVCLVLLASILIPLFFQSLRKNKLPPPHLLHHPTLYEKNLIPPLLGKALLKRVKQLGEFPTNVNDLNFYTTKHEHIGEAISSSPVVDGDGVVCHHPFLIPSSIHTNRSFCVLPGRIDVGRAYVLSGGIEGLKESHPKLVSRVQSFGRYHFLSLSPSPPPPPPPEKDVVDNVPEAKELFALPAFQQLAKQVCPPSAQTLDPFQFNFIINLPGQTVAPHTDAPYFWGADRFHIPQWLLAVMVHSNLFAERFIHQVQVVAYFHTWESKEDEKHEDEEGGQEGESSIRKKRGEFFYWDDESGTPKHVLPHPLSGSGVDGSKVVHAAAVFMPHVNPPLLDKSKTHILRYLRNNGTRNNGESLNQQGDETEAENDRSSSDDDVDDDEGKWILESDDGGCSRNEKEGQTCTPRSYHYNTSQLRFSVVYRARCFESESRRADFYAQRKSTADDDGDMLSLEDILHTLVLDMVIKSSNKGSSSDSNSNSNNNNNNNNMNTNTHSKQQEQQIQRLLQKDSEARLHLALKLIDTYIKYPLSHTALVPINYCAAKLVLPWYMGMLLDLTC